VNDTIGLTYDDDAAVHFGHQTTGLDATIVAAVLRSRDRYELGLGILPEECGEALATTPAAARAKAPELFPAEHQRKRYVSPPLERAFIVRDTGINEHAVRVVLDADLEYMRRRGIAKDIG